MQRYYDLVDVLAYPRQRMRLTELVTPLKPLEAMAQGRMFVASDVGGHRELVRDGETGFLFPGGRRGCLGAGARARARRGAPSGRGVGAGQAIRRGGAHLDRSVARYAPVYAALTMARRVGWRGARADRAR